MIRIICCICVTLWVIVQLGKVFALSRYLIDNNTVEDLKEKVLEDVKVKLENFPKNLFFLRVLNSFNIVFWMVLLFCLVSNLIMLI